MDSAIGRCGIRRIEITADQFWLLPRVRGFMPDRPRVSGKALWSGGERLVVRGVTYGTFRSRGDEGPWPHPNVVAHRTENVRRTAHAARLLADAGMVVLVSLVSPYALDRRNARALHESEGLTFLEVFIDTPLELCEQRDPKGLYARARAGDLPGMTGVDDPYEIPEHPDLVVAPAPVEDQVEAAIDLIQERVVGRPANPDERGTAEQRRSTAS